MTLPRGAFDSFSFRRRVIAITPATHLADSSREPTTRERVYIINGINSDNPLLAVVSHLHPDITRELLPTFPSNE